MQALIFPAAFAGVAFAAFVLVKPFDRRLTWLGGLLFALYLGLDDVATSLPTLVPALRLFGGDWNWTGKVYSLLLSVVAIGALGLKAEAIGLTLKVRNVGTTLLALGLFVAWGCALGLLFDPAPASAETLAFQATMPGLAEELVYRGIAPALLLGLLYGRTTNPGIPWAVIVATALVFGVWHAAGYGKAGFTFDLMSGLFPAIGSLAGGWLRFHSGSLLPVVLAHALANVAFHLVVLVA